MVKLVSKFRVISVAAGFSLLGAVFLFGTTNANDAKEVLGEMDCVVQPSVVADLGVAVPGVLQKLYYDRADYVSSGTVLAELESDLEVASLELAERLSKMTTAIELRQLNAAFGTRTLQRNAILFEKSTISKQTLDQVETESLIAKMQVRQERENRDIARLEAVRARAALQRRKIVSPIDGAITEKYKSVGEYVADEPVFQIAKLDPLRIEVVVPLDYLNTIKSGMTASIQLMVEGFENRDYQAEVRRIDPVADAASGTYGVWLELPNPDLTIPSGVRCQIGFIGTT